MKYLLPLFLFTLMACDVPSQRRQLIKSGTNSVLPPSNISGVDGFNSGNTTPATSPTSGTGFENCSLAPKGSTLVLGSIGVCQSSVDQKMVKFQSSSTDTMRTCLIPTYKAADGSTLYLSSQPQCTSTIAGKIYTGSLVLNRAGYESYPMNGIIIMKENLLESYYQCMNSYSIAVQNGTCVSHPLYNTCRQQMAYYPYAHQTCCEQGARQIQEQVCSTFKGNFGTQYLDIRLR